MLGVDQGSIAQDQGPLEDVAQLTDIAGPLMTPQCLHRFSRQCCRGGSELAEKGSRKRQNIVAPLA